MYICIGNVRHEAWSMKSNLGISLGSPSDFPGISLGFPQDILRTSTGFPKNFLRNSLGIPKDFLDILRIS